MNLNYKHGVYVAESNTNLPLGVQVTGGIAFVVGTAPVQSIPDGKINEIVVCNSFSDFKNAFGYSDDFENYTLCEAADVFFFKYGIAPLICVNVLDPATAKETKPLVTQTVIDGILTLPFDYINDGAINVETDFTQPLVNEVDYTIEHDNKNGGYYLEIITADYKNAVLEYTYTGVIPAAVTAADIIGGIDLDTSTRTGFELIDNVLPLYGLVPEIMLAPKFSLLPQVAGYMQTKADNISEFIKGKALIDIDASIPYLDVEQYKINNALLGINTILCYPKVSATSYNYFLSTHLAAVIMTTDSKYGNIPSKSPSNENLSIGATVNAAGEQIVITHSIANALNSIGVVTALNMGGSFKTWGNHTAVYPADDDPKNILISINRMFGLVSRTCVLTYQFQIDERMTPRLVDSIVNSINIWLNGLIGSSHLVGGRVEYRSDENPTANLIAGILYFHIFITPPSPLIELEFILEYDPAYIGQSFAGGTTNA